MDDAAVGSIDGGSESMDSRTGRRPRRRIQLTTTPTTSAAGRTLVLRCLIPGRLILQSPQWGPRVFFLIWWRVRRPPDRRK